MKENITVKADVRATKGTANVGRLRRSGWIPAVIYSEGKPADPIQLNEHDFVAMLRRHHGEHMIMDLVVGDAKPRKVLLKDLQHHPLKGTPIHADFYEVSMTRKLRVEIPIRLSGDPVGVTGQGGILDHLLRAVEVECLPSDLMEEIVVDVAALELGHHLSVSDIKLDASKYRVVTASDLAIAAVSAPQAEEVAAEAVAAGPEEPEVLTEKKDKDEGEGAEGGKGEKKDEKKSKDEKKPKDEKKSKDEKK